MSTEQQQTVGDVIEGVVDEFIDSMYEDEEIQGLLDEDPGEWKRLVKSLKESDVAAWATAKPSAAAYAVTRRVVFAAIDKWVDIELDVLNEREGALTTMRALARAKAQAQEQTP